MGTARHRLHLPGPRVRRLREPHLAPADLRPTRIRRGEKGFLWRWHKRLPCPLRREDVRAGYVYELAFRQFELSDTRVFDRPAAGRSFFEQLIGDHLDVGRPESVALIFDRRISRRTPGTWRTKVITGVDPQISCDYRSSRIKQYFRSIGRCAPRHP